MPCVCVGCALNPCQLINPALLHSPQALSTVSATLHNHATQGWEVQSRPVGRATLALGTRPPYTPQQLCPELNMQRSDETLAPSAFLPGSPHSWLFISDHQWLQTWRYHLTLLSCTLLSHCCGFKLSFAWQTCSLCWIHCVSCLFSSPWRAKV